MAGHHFFKLFVGANFFFLSVLAKGQSPQISAEQIATGVMSPVAITHAGDHRLFVTEQQGRIRIIDLSTNPPSLLPTPFLDITMIVQSGGEEGLLSVAFDPNYASNGFFYVYYTNKSGNLVIASYGVSSDPNVADPTGTPLLTIDHPGQSNHNGGQLQFGLDRLLYAATGDGGSGNDPPNNAQNRGVLLGKILRLAVNGPAPYTIPAGNPFRDDGDPDTRGEIWALGLRNPFRFTVDRQTGDIFIGDVGQNAREEIDLAPAGVAGLNFGWRVMEGTQCTGLPQLDNPPCNSPGLTSPILEYQNPTGGRSVIAGHRYRGSRLIAPGTLLYSDYFNGIIQQAQPNAEGVWTSSPLLTTGFGLSAFGEDQRGEIYIARQSNPGTVFRLNPTDSDSDGLPNWWESLHFGSTTAAVSSDDSDGDGFTNQQEFNAGTNPRVASSALRISSTEIAGAAFILEFPTVFGKRYQVEFKDDLLISTWSPLGGPILGTGNEIEQRDAEAPDDNRFYRVGLLP